MLTVTNKFLLLLLPQLLTALTATRPLVVFGIATILVVVDVPVHPEVNVHA